MLILELAFYFNCLRKIGEIRHFLICRNFGQRSRRVTEHVSVRCYCVLINIHKGILSNQKYEWALSSGVCTFEIGPQQKKPRQRKVNKDLYEKKR